MKILYLINYAGNGGSEKYVLSLVRKLSGDKTKCLFAYNEPGLLSEQMAQMKVSTFQFEMKNLFDLKAAKTLARICKKNKIDIIHAQYPRENYIAILSHLFYRKTKIVFTSHLILDDVGLVRRFLNKLFTKFDSKIISVCNYGKKLLVHNGYPSKKIKVVYNGVETQENEYQGQNELAQLAVPIDLKEQLGIDKDTFVITTVARISSEKGIELLIDSAKELEAMTSQKFAFVIAGDGDLMPEMKKRVRDKNLENKVFFVGYRSDLEKIFSCADLYVCPSKTEAMSFSILEAMRSGLCVVATNVGGNPEIITEENNCGCLVPYGNALALASEIKRFSEDRPLREKCSENAKRAVCKTFNLDKTAIDTLEIYKKILKK